jgi:hypothetical protein
MEDGVNWRNMAVLIKSAHLYGWSFLDYVNQGIASLNWLRFQPNSTNEFCRYIVTKAGDIFNDNSLICGGSGCFNSNIVEERSQKSYQSRSYLDKLQDR